MKKTKRIISFLIALILAIGIPVALEVNSHAAEYNDIIEAAITIICRSEGTYSTVYKNDNGALSVGKIQWHADHALELLKAIVAEDEVKAKELVGEALFEEIKTSTSWSTRIVNDEEAAYLSALLDSEQGRRVQDKWAFDFVSDYAQHAYRYGVVDPYAIVFLCDVENKGGSSAAYRYMTKARPLAGSYAAIDVDDLYQVAIDFGVTGPGTRRTKLYNYCKSLDFGPTVITGSEEWVVVNDKLNIRTGPDTTYDKVGTYNRGDRVYITERFEGEKYIWGKTDKGWICLYYANYISGSLDYSSLKPPVVGEGEKWKVTVNELRIRSGPDTDFDVVGNYVKDQIILITEKFMGTEYFWGKTDKGWVALNYAEYISGSIGDREDTAGPNISDISVKTVNDKGFSILCKISDVSGIKTVYADVINSFTGKSKRYLPSLVDGKNVFDVALADFENAKGNYSVVINAVDKKGNASVSEAINVAVSYMRGDVNENGKIELNDAMIIIQYIAKKIDVINVPAADVSGDKAITLNDAMRIIEYVAKKTEEL